MLTVDEAARIDVAGIRQHPWFRRPMRPLLEEAIQKMEAEQADNEKEVAMGAYNSAQRDRAVKDLLDVASSAVFREQVRVKRGSSIAPPGPRISCSPPKRL